MDERELIRRTAEHVRHVMAGDSSGHDWWHVYRVWQMAIRLAASTDADLAVVELGALLHDIADWKMNDGDLEIGPLVAREWLESHQADPKVVDQVSSIVAGGSFIGAGVPDKAYSLESQIVQDADRLDALGAVGVGRAFAFGGAHDRLMYDPEIKPTYHDNFESYKSSASPTINHFYEKLFLLKDRMHTAAGRKMAETRHQYMMDFVNRFYMEWDGKM
ncbi:MAG: HD domain-containing protein [Streptosporangiaceae bacterium]